MYLLRAHRVFVTKNRQPMLTDAMLTFCEQTVLLACGALAAELVKFNREADHTLIAYPPTVSTLTQRLEGRAACPVRRDFTDVLSAQECADTFGPRPTSLCRPEAHRCRSSTNIGGQPRPH